MIESIFTILALFDNLYNINYTSEQPVREKKKWKSFKEYEILVLLQILSDINIKWHLKLAFG